MRSREVVVYVSLGLIASSLLFASYFFLRKPEKIALPPREEVTKAPVLKDVTYSGESKGVINWEIRAKTARTFTDRPVAEMEGIDGKYKPQADAEVRFTGSQGTMDMSTQRGNVQDVSIFYKDEYVLTSKFMDFDFRKGVTSTSAPVDIKGKRLTLTGLGLTADTKAETVKIEKDVTGFIETEKGKFKFDADSFVYRFKENLYILDGKVVMKGENMSLLCATLYLQSEGDDIKKIDARGKVRLLAKGSIAKSEKAVYYVKEDKIILTESPTIEKDRVEMEGKAIVYTLTDGRFTVDQPRMRIQR
jgi:lipopolysaccharide transport protein LptA/LPS export ABC transporter protein LptC